MAVRTTCPRCGKRFSAPDEYRGRKESCPRCGHRFILRSAEDERAEREEQQQARRREEEDRRRLALIEQQEERIRRRGGQPYYERYQTGQDAVRHYDPNAPSRFLRLRALSDVLIVAAYFAAMLAMVGAGLTLQLKIDGTIESLPLLLVLLAGWVAVGVLLFLVLKVLGEMAFLMADLGDHQSDVVQLLLDIRDDLERERTPRRQA